MITTKPHCKKHEVYEQGCIGCRIMAKPVQSRPLGRPYVIGAEHILEPINPDDIHDLHYIDHIPGLEPAPRAGDDMATTGLKAKQGLVKSAKKKEQVVKQFLKDVYRDGALGNKRNLQDDMETLQRLVQQNAGHKA